MAKGRRRGSGPTATEQRMRRLLEAQARGGLSLAEFARRRGIPAGRLRWWKLELRRRASEYSGVSRAAEPPAVSLVPVRVGPSRLPRLLEDAGFEIELSDGTRIRVPPGFDPESLRHLLQALRTSC